MTAEYKPAPEVAAIAHQLITRVTQHQELVNSHIEYVFIKEAPKSKGRKIGARCELVNGARHRPRPAARTAADSAQCPRMGPVDLVSPAP